MVVFRRKSREGCRVRGEHERHEQQRTRRQSAEAKRFPLQKGKLYCNGLQIKSKTKGREKGKPNGRGKGFAKRKGFPYELQSQRCREDLQKETTMEKFKHKYIFYFYPNLIDIAEGRKGIFRFFGRAKDGKEFAAKTSRQYDYKKIY